MIDLIRGTRNLAGATLLALTVATPARAAPVLWTLSDFVFTDGATASGSFIYDADLNAYGAIDITTTAGAERSGAHYTQLSFGVVPAALEVLMVEEGTGADQTGADVIYMAFEFALTNAGGLVELILMEERDCANAACTGPAPTNGRNASGDVIANASAVPEPETLMLLGLGLAAIGLQLRRRHR